MRFSLKEYLEDVKDGDLIDYDGYGHPIVDGKMLEDIVVKPSRPDLIPEGTTHIKWYNR